VLEMRPGGRQGDRCGRRHGASVSPPTSSYSPLYWQTRRLTDGVMQSLSSARQSEVKAWEEEIIACEHALLVEQRASGAIPAQGT
jgi:hypothetical protein